MRRGFLFHSVYALAAVLISCVLSAGLHTNVCAAQRNILIGLVNNNEPGFRAEVLNPTLEYLQQSLSDISFRTVDIAAYKATGVCLEFCVREVSKGSQVDCFVV